jgi:hypothetical protein
VLVSWALVNWVSVSWVLVSYLVVYWAVGSRARRLSARVLLVVLMLVLRTLCYACTAGSNNKNDLFTRRQQIRMYCLHDCLHDVCIVYTMRHTYYLHDARMHVFMRVCADTRMCT